MSSSWQTFWTNWKGTILKGAKLSGVIGAGVALYIAGRVSESSNDVVGVKPTEIKVGKGMTEVFEGFASSWEALGDKRTGLVATEVTVEFNVAVSAKDEGTLTLALPRPDQSKIDGSVGQSGSAETGNKIKVTFRHPLTLETENTLAGRPVEDLERIFRMLGGVSYIRVANTSQTVSGTSFHTAKVYVSSLDEEPYWFKDFQDHARDWDSFLGFYSRYAVEREKDDDIDPSSALYALLVMIDENIHDYSPPDNKVEAPLTQSPEWFEAFQESTRTWQDFVTFFQDKTNRYEVVTLNSAIDNKIAKGPYEVIDVLNEVWDGEPEWLGIWRDYFGYDQSYRFLTNPEYKPFVEAFLADIDSKNEEELTDLEKQFADPDFRFFLDKILAIEPSTSAEEALDKEELGRAIDAAVLPNTGGEMFFP